MKYVLSTVWWLEKLAKQEIIREKYKITEVQDRLVCFDWPIEAIARINLWSRVGNKLYLELAEKKLKNFDDLYDLVNQIDFKKYIPKNSPILVKATSVRSKLSSTPAIQKIVKKAIVNKLLEGTSKDFLKEKDEFDNFEIFVLIINDRAKILINTSGDALHKRAYRKYTWEAPIKENLAAAIVLLSNWNFKKPFYDPFCWSWTIAIEALLIARNIAPGINRKFAFEDWNFVPEWLMQAEIKRAKEKEFDWEYRIFASDLDFEMVEIAKQNAKLAGLKWKIIFDNKDFREFLEEDLEGTLVTNPPYWLRLKDDNLEKLYKDLDKIFEKNEFLNWWFITSFEEENNFYKTKYKKRKLYNWAQKVYFFKKVK